MTITAMKPITIEEFLQLPETEPASESINAEIIQKPMPQGEHSQLQIDLCEMINQITKPQKIAKAFPALRCVFGGLAIAFRNVRGRSLFAQSMINSFQNQRSPFNQQKTPTLKQRV
jgi:hypothetical protein